MRPDLSQVPVLNTKEADVAYLRRIETYPMCEKYWVSDPTLETKWAKEIIKICRLQIVKVNIKDHYRIFKLMFQHLINS